MVLPAWAANPLRSMITAGGAANNNAPFSANGGNVAYHYHNHSKDAHPAHVAMSERAFVQMARNVHRNNSLNGSWTDRRW